MTTATIAVKGRASDDYPADYALLHLGHGFKAPARSDALTGANAVVAQLRDVVAQRESGVRGLKIQSLRVQETFDQGGSKGAREPSGWVGEFSGQLMIEPVVVPEIIAELARIGVTIYQTTWHLDPDTEARAQREVRRRAVADAQDAATDFALALGARLGPLLTLADPGLLSGATFAGAMRASSGTAASGRATNGPATEHVDIDPEPITISAGVEASFEVTLDD